MLLLFAVLVLLSAVAVPVVGPRLLGRQARLAHRRCLENIARLEREMGIGLEFAKVYVEPPLRRSLPWDKKADGSYVPVHTDFNFSPVMASSCASSPSYMQFAPGQVWEIDGYESGSAPVRSPIVLPDGVTLH